jgi:hypothetical protein
MNPDSQMRERLLEQILSGETELSARELELLSDSQRAALQRLSGLLGTPRPAAEARPEARVKSEELIQAGFRTFGLLGSGVHASVYDAEDLTLGRRVALKVVYSGWNDDVAQRTFLREARTLARIQHPNVVSVWSAAASEGRLLIALEFIEGRNLRQVLAARGPLPAAEAARIARDIARALEAVHAAGILHRDVNPNNVMLESAGRVVLLDFSVARTKGGDALRRGSTLGSPVFEAPEVLAGDSPSERSDVYSLGILLLWMCSGASPFEGTTWGDLRRNALEGRRLPLAKVAPAMPAGLRRIVERCLQREPAARTPSAQALAKDLDNFLLRPRRTGIALLGLAGLLGIGALAYDRGGAEVPQELPVDEAVQVENFIQRDLRNKTVHTMREWRMLEAPRGLEDLGPHREDPAADLGFAGRRLRVPEDFTTIADAVAASVDGDVILVGPGIYREAVDLLNRSVALVGVEGAANTVIDATGFRAPVIHVGDPTLPRAEGRLRVVLRGLGCTGGSGVNKPSTFAGGDWYGGGIGLYVDKADLTVEECAIWNNGRAGSTFGGGFLCVGGTENAVTLRRCLIAGNGAWACGGGVMFDQGRGRIEHCTIVENYSGNFLGQQGGIGIANGAQIEVLDSLLWGNSGDQIGIFQGYGDGCDTRVERSLIQGAGNIGKTFSKEPRFRDAGEFDWRIAEDSPARREQLGVGFEGLDSDLGAFLWVAPKAGPEQAQLRSAGVLTGLPAGIEKLGATPDLPADAIAVRVPEDHPTVQAAIDAAPAGATISIGPGVWRESLSLPPRALTIVGRAGAGATVVDARDAAGSAIDISFARELEQDVGVRLRGLTLLGGTGRLLAPRSRAGGGVCISGRCKLEVESCVLWRNGRLTTTIKGGSLWIGQGAAMVMRDCLIAESEVEMTGSVAAIEAGRLTLQRCTLVRNNSSPRIGAPSAVTVGSESWVVVEGSILWDNNGSQIRRMSGNDTAHVQVSNSVIAGGHLGEGVLDIDPLFANPSDADWRLSPASPPEVRSLGALR